MWLNVLTILSCICFGFLLDVSSRNAEVIDDDLVKRINHVNAKVKTMVSNYHELLKTFKKDGRKLDSLIKQNQDLNQRLNKTVDKMEKLITNEETLNQTIRALQTLTSEQQRELNKEKSMSKNWSSNYSDRLLRVNREVDFLKKQNHYLERKLNTTVEKMEKLMSEKETLSYNIENLQNITSQQQHALNKAEYKSKESRISIGSSLTLLNNKLQKLTNSTSIGLKNVNGNVLKENPLLRNKLRKFEKRIKQRINKKLDKIDPVCQQPKHKGPCYDFTMKHFFNTSSSKCEPFWYGGCKGNQNNFQSDEECQAACVQEGAIDLQKMTKDVIDLNTKATEIKYSTDKLMSNIILISSKQEQTDKDVTDLQAHVTNLESSTDKSLSNLTLISSKLEKTFKDVRELKADVHGTWSVWSETTCSVTCGVGTSLRSRNCSNPHPQYGGNNCTGKSIDHLLHVLSLTNVQVTFRIKDNSDVKIQESGQQSRETGVTIRGQGQRTVREGETVTIECDTTGIRNAVVLWRKRDGLMPPNHSVRGGTLTISNFRSVYRGEYICSASSPVKNYETSVFIIVTVTPSLTISPARVEARKGGTVQLRCQPHGSGPFGIKWLKVDGVLNPSATQTRDGLLKIRQVTAADTGRYRCLATGSSGSSDGFVILSVTVPPTITLSQREARPYLGQLMELRCQASGNPPPSITWEKENGVLPRDHTVNNGVLQIFNVRQEDSGRYICQAASPAGVDREYVTLTIQGRNTASPAGVDREYVTLTVEGRNRTPVPLPTVTWSRIGEPLPETLTVTDVFLVIPHIKIKDAGIYVCTVQNLRGTAQHRVNLIVKGDQLTIT
ncbi:Hypothetical predicted protein [Mytilus galloprovincialis]|uniref:Uncharacterized protein n=1 Tax=Mytilus galloprovincialis TaxID=29158 RepID=A0A8B6D3E8_MYTGA|nr:Hypothetical predicted protein [Mytilus galloprovincialis]